MSAKHIEILSKKLGLSCLTDRLGRESCLEKHKVRLEVGSRQFGAESSIGIPRRFG